MSFEHRHEDKSCSACRDRVNERVWECENVTFQHSHENKSCSACPKDQHQHFTYYLIAWQTITFYTVFDIFGSELLSKTFDMFYLKYTFKFSKHSWFPAFVWHSDIFSWEPALETLNSQEEAEAEVKKKALQFSAINSDFWA